MPNSNYKRTPFLAVFLCLLRDVDIPLPRTSISKR
jgi:hypothetical protein